LKAAAEARSSAMMLQALVRILSLSSLPKKLLKQPVECTNFSKGITAAGLFRRKDKDPAL
jgi:hypothetical protein